MCRNLPTYNLYLIINVLYKLISGMPDYLKIYNAIVASLNHKESSFKFLLEYTTLVDVLSFE